jgi:ketosteroid isomerase-like protein
VTSFEDFLLERERASTAFVEGDPAPLLALSVITDPATIYPPNGTVVEGAVAVNAGNTAGSSAFTRGASNHFEILHSGTDGDLAYLTGIQRSTVVLKDTHDQIKMDLRLTELYRRIDGEWRLFHRHADTLMN